MDARKAGAVALTIISYVLRVCGIVMCLMVIALNFAGVAAKMNLVGFVVDLSRAIPASIAGYGIIASPFGGVFRFDFALVAAACFALDYVCARVARSLR